MLLETGAPGFTLGRHFGSTYSSFKYISPFWVFIPQIISDICVQRYKDKVICERILFIVKVCE